MAYVANTLADDEKEKQEQEALPSLGGATPAANTIGASSAPQPMSGGAPAQQQKTPQQQKGTGFVNLSSWLDAGKGRDKTISNAGATNKAKETENWTTASNTAKTGLAASQPVQVDSVTKQLDREAGILNDGVSGPSLSDVVNQSYKGPTSIDYTAGEGMTNLQNLSKASTAADTLAKPEVEAGRYGAGLRSLDAVLFGADAESQKALAQNATDVTGLKDTATKGAADFEARVGSTIDTMNKNATGVRDELGAINTKQAADVADRVRRENENQDILNIIQNTPQQLRNTPVGKVSEWQAGEKATAGNMQTADEQKRFAALSKLLGFDAPAVTGQYQAGKQVTRDETPEEQTARIEKAQADAEASRPVSQEYTNKFNDSIGKAIEYAMVPVKFGAGAIPGMKASAEFIAQMKDFTPEQRKYLLDQYQAKFANMPGISQDQKKYALEYINSLRGDDWESQIMTRMR